MQRRKEKCLDTSGDSHWHLLTPADTCLLDFIYCRIFHKDFPCLAKTGNLFFRLQIDYTVK